MADAGFDPRARLTLWRKLSAASDTQPLAFLSTHPSNVQRLQDLSAEMDAALERYRQSTATGRRPTCSTISTVKLIADIRPPRPAAATSLEHL